MRVASGCEDRLLRGETLRRSGRSAGTAPAHTGRRRAGAGRFSVVDPSSHPATMLAGLATLIRDSYSILANVPRAPARELRVGRTRPRLRPEREPGSVSRAAVTVPP